MPSEITERKISTGEGLKVDLLTNKKIALFDFNSGFLIYMLDEPNMSV